MSFGKGALLWLIGIPLPIILLIALTGVLMAGFMVGQSSFQG